MRFCAQIICILLELCTQALARRSSAGSAIIMGRKLMASGLNQNLNQLGRLAIVGGSLSSQMRQDAQSRIAYERRRNMQRDQIKQYKKMLDRWNETSTDDTSFEDDAIIEADTDDPLPFAAYVIESDDGKLVLDDDHIYYNQEHYFAHIQSVPQHEDRLSNMVCTSIVPDNSTLAQLWLSANERLSTVHFKCRADMEVCCQLHCCWSATKMDSRQRHLAFHFFLHMLAWIGAALLAAILCCVGCKVLSASKERMNRARQAQIIVANTGQVEDGGQSTKQRARSMSNHMLQQVQHYRDTRRKTLANL